VGDELVRLNRLLARRGISSRRGAERLIAAGRVTVDGQVISEQGVKVPESAHICLDGRPVAAPPPLRYIALNKPQGYVTTRDDPGGRPTVMRFLPSELRHLHPVGRLDRDTEGLLLFTNDGDLTLALTHPRHGVEKVYRACVSGVPSSAELRSLRQGVSLSDCTTLPALVRLLSAEEGNAEVEIELHEGRKRQVRRMFDTVEHPVIRLRRIRVGPVSLGDLGEGEIRELTHGELVALRGLLGRGGGEQAPPAEHSSPECGTKG